MAPSEASSPTDAAQRAAEKLEREPGFRHGFHEDRNRLNRRTMEDAHSVQVNFARVHGQGFFAVYDGHAGKQAAQWCGENVHKIFEALLDECPDTPIPELLNATFERADQQLAMANIHSGCTAIACFLHVTQDRRVLYTANVGDARAVLCRKGQAIRLSYDHKGSDPFEAKRIVDAGGFMVNNRVNGVLAVTRSLGDASMKELVVGNPYTTELELTVDDEFLILACDGVWDVMSDQEAVNLLLGVPEPQDAAELLVAQALENMSTDNLSAIIVRLVHPKRRPSNSSETRAQRQDNGDDDPQGDDDIEEDNDDTPTPRSFSAALRREREDASPSAAPDDKADLQDREPVDD